MQSLLNCHTSGCIEAGCDEAGRGCLAGPVFAAAVILPFDFSNDELNDSKKLTERQRYKLRDLIEERAVAWSVAQIDANEIDEINILNASIKAMHKALDGLALKPEHVIVDGNRFKQWRNVDYDTIIKGDGKYMSIAAASILAKTYRDDYMIELSKMLPEYEWHNNKGYPTVKHRIAIAKYGATEYHRKSFTLLDRQQTLDFGD